MTGDRDAGSVLDCCCMQIDNNPGISEGPGGCQAAHGGLRKVQLLVG